MQDTPPRKPRRTAFRLPPHVAWPLFIVALLLLSASTALLILVAARSDGGAQVVPDYYQQAAKWEEQARVQAASQRLGWQATAQIHPADANGRHLVNLHVLDRDGRPVTDLTGTVRLERPHLAEPVATLAITPAPDAPDTYQFTLPAGASGLWDLHLSAARGSDVYQTTLRKEIRPE